MLGLTETDGRDMWWICLIDYSLSNMIFIDEYKCFEPMPLIVLGLLQWHCLHYHACNYNIMSRSIFTVVSQHTIDESV